MLGCAPEAVLTVAEVRGIPAGKNTGQCAPVFLMRSRSGIFISQEHPNLSGIYEKP